MNSLNASAKGGNSSIKKSGLNKESVASKSGTTLGKVNNKYNSTSQFDKSTTKSDISSKNFKSNSAVSLSNSKISIRSIVNNRPNSNKLSWAECASGVKPISNHGSKSQSEKPKVCDTLPLRESSNNKNSFGNYSKDSKTAINPLPIFRDVSKDSKTIINHSSVHKDVLSQKTKNVSKNFEMKNNTATKQSTIDEDGWISVDRKSFRKKDSIAPKIHCLDVSEKSTKNINFRIDPPKIQNWDLKKKSETNIKNDPRKLKVGKKENSRGNLDFSLKASKNYEATYRDNNEENLIEKLERNAASKKARDLRRQKEKEESRIKRETKFLRDRDQSRRDTKISFISQESMDKFLNGDKPKSKVLNFNKTDHNEYSFINNKKVVSGGSSKLDDNSISRYMKSDNSLEVANNWVTHPTAPPLDHHDPPPSYSSVIAADKKRVLYEFKSPSKSIGKISPKKNVKAKDPVQFNIFNLLESNKKGIGGKSPKKNMVKKSLPASLAKDAKKGKEREFPKKKRLSTLKKNMLLEASKRVNLLSFIKMLQHQSSIVTRPAVKPILYPKDVEDDDLFLPQNHEEFNRCSAKFDDPDISLGGDILVSHREESFEFDSLGKLIYNLDALKVVDDEINLDEDIKKTTPEIGFGKVVENENILDKDIKKVGHPLDFDSDSSDSELASSSRHKLPCTQLSGLKLETLEPITVVPIEKDFKKLNSIVKSTKTEEKLSICPDVKSLNIEESSISSNQSLKDKDKTELVNTKEESEAKIEKNQLQIQEVDPEIRKKIMEEIEYLTDPVHNNRFREYCHHIVSPEINEALSIFIAEVVRLQQNMFAKDPRKAKIRQRYYCGLKEAIKKMHKLKCVIIAPDIKRSPGPGCLDEMVDKLHKTAFDAGVPVLYGLNRYKLGKLCIKSTKVSCISMVNYQGAQDQFRALMEMIPKAKKQYEELIARYKKEKIILTETEDEHADEEPVDSKVDSHFKNIDSTSTSIIFNTMNILKSKN